MSKPIQFVRDKNGCPIMPGDILKVFHFVGARRKRHYMYKQAVAYERHPRGSMYLKISHLNRINDEAWEPGKNFFTELADGNVRPLFEIIQSIRCDHADRPTPKQSEDADGS